MVAEYDIGQGVERLEENRRLFSDGSMHTIYFRRHNEKAVMRVDSYDERTGSGSSSNVQMFTRVSVVKIGGKLDQAGKIVSHIEGIISGKQNRHNCITG